MATLFGKVPVGGVQPIRLEDSRFASIKPFRWSEMSDQFLIGVCRDCAHWQKATVPKIGYYKGWVWGACRKGVGEIGNAPTHDGCVGDGREEDGTGDGLTGPDFGCIHWREKQGGEKEAEK